MGGVRVVGLVGNKANSAPLELELGLSLAIIIPIISNFKVNQS